MNISPADHELTNAEILDRFGSLLGEAVEAFTTDATYLAEMAEAWATINAHREARRERVRRSKPEPSIPPVNANRDAEIVELIAGGQTHAAVARQYGISPGRVGQIAKAATDT